MSFHTKSQFVPSLEVADYSKKESHFVPKSIRTKFGSGYEMTWVRND